MPSTLCVAYSANRSSHDAHPRLGGLVVHHIDTVEQIGEVVVPEVHLDHLGTRSGHGGRVRRASS